MKIREFLTVSIKNENNYKIRGFYYAKWPLLLKCISTKCFNIYVLKYFFNILN